MGIDWQHIVREHGPAVWRTARRLLGSEADAADCFQETFLAAVTFARREQVNHWPALLQRLATNKALDRLRQRQRESQRSEGNFEIDSMPTTQHSPTTPAEAAELADQLRRALILIPVQQAEAFCLHHLESHSYEDIAAQLDVTVNHVGVLLHRARKQLQPLLRDTSPGSVAERIPNIRSHMS